jgi:hypothetical protein
MGERRHAHRISLHRFLGRRQHGRPSRRMDGIIKIEFSGASCEDVKTHGVLSVEPVCSGTRESSFSA